MAIKPVIVGTDGSAASARAVAWAVQEAVRRDVPLRIVRSCRPASTAAGSFRPTRSTARYARLRCTPWTRRPAAPGWPHLN
jgi:nucleotide-binding universal stress UspA family protein